MDVKFIRSLLIWVQLDKLETANECSTQASSETNSFSWWVQDVSEANTSFCEAQINSFVVKKVNEVLEKTFWTPRFLLCFPPDSRCWNHQDFFFFSNSSFVLTYLHSLHCLSGRWYRCTLQMELMTRSLCNLKREKNPDVSIWTQCLGLMLICEALSGFGMRLERWGDVTFMICARRRHHQAH